MIERTEFLRSIEENLKHYEEELAKTPKEASVLRNIILGQIKAVHKVKADALLGGALIK